MTQTDAWYYFDANILIVLDNSGLIETLKPFKEKKMAKLLITNEINKELQGKPKRRGSKNHGMPKIKNLIQEGILDIIEPIDLSGSDTDDSNLLTLDAGEESLLQAIVQRNRKHPKAQHIFVTNDQRALKRAVALDLKIETITDYLSFLTCYQIIKCERALTVSEIALSKISEHRNGTPANLPDGK